MVGSSRAWIESDYRILPGGRRIKTKESAKSGTLVELNANKRFLFINFNRLSSLYWKECKDMQHAIPKESLKYYLEHSPEYLGTILAMKFKQPDNQLGYAPSDPSMAKTRTTTAMVFDYDAIVDNYGISLEIATGFRDNEPLPGEQPIAPPEEEVEDMPLF